MNIRETQDCIERARTGSRSAFAELVRSYQQFAYGIAFRLLWDAHEAEDIVQETFVRIWRHLHRWDPEQAFTTWMYVIVTNLCRDRLRERNRRPFLRMESEQMEQFEDPAGIFEAPESVDLLNIVRRLTERLPLKQRLVFTLRDLQDLSVQEVARIAGISEASVKTNLHLARRKLRALLIQEYRITGVEP
jgi:RNA polymerase sigma-70 factor (ECF subfamily)